MSLYATNTSGFMLLQSDWNLALQNEGDRVWLILKYYDCNHSTNHAEILVKAKKSGVPQFDMTENFEIKNFSKYAITVTNSLLGITTQFIAPVKVFENLHKKRITALDISSGGGLGVSASTDETLYIWDTYTGEIRRNLIGHVGDVNCCKFFPSGLVVLSGGMDTQLKIWSAEDGSCARTLNGSHKSGILSIGFVERGRNILSASRDGTVCLWECGTGTCLDKIVTKATEINCCCITDTINTSLSVNSATTKNDLEVGTKNKLLAIVCESGLLELYALHSRSCVFSLKHNEALNSCCFVNSTTVAAGSQDGSLLIFDLRWPNGFIIDFNPCKSPVLCMHSSHTLSHPCFWVSCGNGRCSLYQVIITPRNEKVSSNKCPFDGALNLICELTGSDCDPVYQVVESSDGFVYTSCRNSKIRKYKLAHIA